MVKKAQTAELIRSRIVGHGDVKPDELLANPLNFRVHPGHQMDALRGSMKELGWLKTILVNKTTGHVLDGHARVKEAMRQGLPTIPATIVELTPEEERLALAVLDPITELATRDDQILAELLDQVSTDDPGLQALLDEMAGKDDDAGGTGADKDAARATLAERFGVPPFSVLNAREGWWQGRKRAWLALGIRSEIGRGGGGWNTTAPARCDQEPRRDAELWRDQGAGSTVRQAAPGGSARPACDYSKKQRGDGRGRGMK